MIDHLALKVKNVAQSKKFYAQVLEPLGYQLGMDEETVANFNDSRGGAIFLIQGEPAPFHLAFQADNHEQVQNFYDIALKSGAKDNGAPGYRPHYHENYYACFVIDPDGYPIESVCHKKVD